MDNSERISDLINQYIELIKDSYHKTKDGYFWIERVWAGYDDNPSPRYQALHSGYLNKLEAPKRYTESASEEDMIKFLEEIIENWEPDE